MPRSKRPTELKTLGQNILNTRMNKGITGIALANKVKETGISVTESYLCRIEKDKQVPTKELIQAIEKALSLKPGKLLRFSCCTRCGRKW